MVRHAWDWRSWCHLTNYSLYLACRTDKYPLATQIMGPEAGPSWGLFFSLQGDWFSKPLQVKVNAWGWRASCKCWLFPGKKKTPTGAAAFSSVGFAKGRGSLWEHNSFSPPTFLSLLAGIHTGKFITYFIIWSQRSDEQEDSALGSNRFRAEGVD